jgi:hypothetical protein
MGGEGPGGDAVVAAAPRNDHKILPRSFPIAEIPSEVSICRKMYLY